MKLNTKGRLITTTTLGTIGLIAIAIGWANTEVQDAGRQRQHDTEIALRLSEQRLVTFEYLLARHERARLQERAAATRLDRLIATHPAAGPEQMALLAHLRERSAVIHQMFDELVAVAGPSPVAWRPGDAALQRFEAQVSSRLLILQQESLADAFRLIDLATERIQRAQQRVVAMILAGLGLIALTTVGTAWLLNRHVLVPIRRLQQGTREVAAGNWGFKLDVVSNDEIGDMSRNFDAMTRSLRDSFAQIEKSNHELAELNREIEAFSYSVSHDLRGPLRSMDGFSMALLEDYGDKLGDEARDHLQRIRAASQRMGRLIDDLLRLSRVTRADLHLKPVDLSAMAREIADGLTQQQPARQVRWEIEPGMVVRADKALIQIALQNLLDNAWKFTSRTAEAVIRVGTRHHDGHKEYFVADNGVGFDMGYAERLFGAFQRMHHEADFPGTGIGLAIVQRVFRRHGGGIRAEAQAGAGASFYFWLRESNHD